MELRHLRYFSVLGSELHFGRAAARLGITQPPLSRQIQDLEREVGVPLLTRDRHRVGLTDAGRRFLEEARRTLEAADRAMDSARNSGSPVKGRLEVGACDAGQMAVLSKVLPRLRESHPGLRVDVRCLPAGPLAAALRSGEVRVGLVLLPFSGRDLLVEPVVEEAPVLGLPRRHPLAARGRIALSELKGESFCLPSRELAPDYHDFGADLVRRSGSRVEDVVVVDSLPGTLVHVAAGLGVAIVPPSAALLGMEGVVFRPFGNEVGTGGVAVARPREKPTPPVETFLDAVHEAFPRRRGR